MAPVLLAWGNAPHLGGSAARVGEALVFAVLVWGAGQFAFGSESRPVYVVLPLFVWAAFRFGQRGATLAVLAVAGLALWRTAQGDGPFVGPASVDSLVQLQLFMSVVALTALFLVAALAERVRAQEALRFLAEASTQVASSLDYKTTLQRVARLALPVLADWCYVALLDADQFRVVAVAHVDPAKEALAWELERRYPPNPDPTRAGGFSTALRTGRPFLDAEVSEARQAAHARDTRHLELLRRLEPTSYIVAPLVARGQTLGVLVCFSADGRRRYGPADLPLAEEVARRAAVAVDNARLYRDAQEGIRVRDEFLSIAAHELKTPITSLKGRAQLAVRLIDREGTADLDRTRQAFAGIERQSTKLTQLVGKLLDVSRLEAGHLVLEREAADLMRVVHEAVATASATTNRHAITVQGPPSVPAFVDPLRVEQVMTNLLENAIKYSPQGGPIVVSVSSPESTTVRIAVADRGIGIPPEHRLRIFDRFYQAHTQDHRSGLGLGLYLSHQIVALHGGYLEVAFPAAGGTCFTVTLPVGSSALAPGRDPVAAHGSQSPTGLGAA